MAQLAREVVLGQTSSVIHPDEFTRVNIGTPRSHSRRLSHPAEELESSAPLIAAVTQVEAQREGLVPSGNEAFSKRVRLGIRASWVVNILLLIVKAAAFVLSGSYAVLASAVDSLVDILSQAVLAVAEYQAARFDHRFPIGRTRMAELSVLACACIMFISTTLVIRESIGSLWEGFHGHLPNLVVDKALFIVLAAATVLKLGLYIYCQALRKNPIMVALSEDHLNDVMSNVAAIGGAAVAGFLPRYWYADPAVALLFSLFIIRNWLLICWDQGQKMIGLEAPEELIQEVTEVTTTHNPAMQLDRLTAYHHGSHIVVEVEVILPAGMTVRESHDIALELQHKIEAIDSVERAFVHVDYARRSLEEHKVERNLKLGEKDVMKPLAGLEGASPVAHGSSQSNGTDDGSAAGISAAADATAGGPPAPAPAGLEAGSSSRSGGGAAAAAAGRLWGLARGGSSGGGEGPSSGGNGSGFVSASGSGFMSANGSSGCFGSAAGHLESASDVEAPPEGAGNAA